MLPSRVMVPSSRSIFSQVRRESSAGLAARPGEREVHRIGVPIVGWTASLRPTASVLLSPSRKHAGKYEGGDPEAGIAHATV